MEVIILMNRNKAIDELVEFYAEEYSEVDKNGLRNILTSGFKGFENHTDKELEEWLENVKEIKEGE